MEQIYTTLDVKRWAFGFTKAFEKQHFRERLTALMPDKTKYGDNAASVSEAFETALTMLHKLWNDPTRLSLVCKTIRVLISFDADYSTWMVEMEPFVIGPRLRETHPDFKAAAEKEKNQIIEKYGFIAEKRPEKKYDVSFSGLHAVMTDKQFDNFMKDIIAMYPNNWCENFRLAEIKDVEDEK